MLKNLPTKLTNSDTGIYNNFNEKIKVIDDGFKVVPRETVNTFKVTAGAGYVSGLRVELAADHILTLSSYPQFVYVDAWFDGTNESIWRGQVVFTVTNTEMDDYIDVNGKQHYVFKLASISAANTVVDLRGETNFASRNWSNNKFVSKDDAKIKFQPKESNLNSFMRCTNASPLAFTGTMFQPDDLNKSTTIKATDVNTGVLVDAQYGAYFDFILPYAVIIGDSISEGHPALHGRLHPGAAAFDPDYESLPGQLSYEFSGKFNIPFVNHGIGSQTSVDVRNRWARDVLHQIVDVGDGRGSQTMDFGGQLPYLVYLHVGINDVNLGVSVNTIKENFEFFAQSCRDNNILLIVDNIGAYSGYGLSGEAAAITINEWLVGEFSNDYPEVEVVDYLGWSSDGTYNYRILKSGMFADTIHPNIKGYADFANFAADRIRSAVFLNSLVVDSAIDGPTRFSRVTRFIFNDNEFTTNGEAAVEFEFRADNNKDNPVSKLIALDFNLITGDGTDQYTGFCQAYGKFSSANKKAVLSSLNSKNDIVAAAVISQGVLSGSWKKFGIDSIDTSDLAAGNIKVILTNNAQLLTVNMIGSLNQAHEYSPRWTSGSVGQAGAKEWVINLKKSSDGTLATTLLTHNYQIIAYNFF